MQFSWWIRHHLVWKGQILACRPWWGGGSWFDTSFLGFQMSSLRHSWEYVYHERVRLISFLGPWPYQTIPSFHPVPSNQGWDRKSPVDAANPDRPHFNPWRSGWKNLQLPCNLSSRNITTRHLAAVRCCWYSRVGYSLLKKGKCVLCSMLVHCRRFPFLSNNLLNFHIGGYYTIFFELSIYIYIYGAISSTKWAGLPKNERWIIVAYTAVVWSYIADLIKYHTSLYTSRLYQHVLVPLDSWQQCRCRPRIQSVEQQLAELRARLSEPPRAPSEHEAPSREKTHGFLSTI